MANTPGTLNGTLVAQRTLSTLLVMFPMLAMITTDFSAEGVKFNQTVNSRVVTASVADDYDTTNGYVDRGRTSVDVPIVIDKHKHHTYAVNDQERSSTNRNLIQEWADTGAHALGKQMMDDLFAKMLAATITNQYQVAAANFDRDDVVNIRTKLNKRFVPDLGRFMCINSDLYGNLSLDATIVANLYNNESDAIGSGEIKRVHGFGISEYSSMPSNNEKLVGIAGNREGLIIATRLPEAPSAGTPIPGVIETVTEPHTGLSVQLRSWYDMGKGKEYRTLTLMYGTALGLSGTAACDRLERLVIP